MHKWKLGNFHLDRAPLNSRIDLLTESTSEDLEIVIYPLRFRSTIEPNVVWQINDEKCLGLLSAYRRGGGERSASLFRWWPAVVNKPIVLLSEDVKRERERTFISSTVDGTAIVTIRDLQGGGCVQRSQYSKCLLYDTLELGASKLSHNPIYFCRANVGFKVLEGEIRSIESG
jgi:hypothetical protein